MEGSNANVVDAMPAKTRTNPIRIGSKHYARSSADLLRRHLTVKVMFSASEARMTTDGRQLKAN